MSQPLSAKKVTAPLLRAAKGQSRITALTAYDYPTARIVDESGIDVVLVGDSLGPNILGLESTIPVTLDDMVFATRAVTRGVKRALIVGDLPFGTYHESPEQAMRSSIRLIQQGGASAVKMEGGCERRQEIKKVVDAGIPVMAHIGLRPQSMHQMGGFKVQGKTEAQAKQLLLDAEAVEEAGAFSVVLEGIPSALGKQITESVSIPTIGIGAGPDCDGQILVFSDLVGLTFGHVPRFVRQYADARSHLSEAVAAYRKDIVDGSFPNDEESYPAS